MGLANTYTQVPSKLESFFKQLQDAQAPEQLTQQLLKDWGFASTNDRAFIPVLKAIGFLTSEGKPTKVYHDYRDHSKSRSVLGNALRSSYSDIFLIKNHPTSADEAAITGKFKSYFNASDTTAQRQAKTFLGLLELADISEKSSNATTSDVGSHSIQSSTSDVSSPTTIEASSAIASHPVGLHYNIQIHLPATKDVEVYNAIFKSLKEHLIE